MYTESFQPGPAEPDPAALKTRVAEFLPSFHLSLVPEHTV